MPALSPHDPIEHVIVLMLENRSFDHMLGGLAASIPDLDGIPPAGQPPRLKYPIDKWTLGPPGERQHMQTLLRAIF